VGIQGLLQRRASLQSAGPVCRCGDQGTEGIALGLVDQGLSSGRLPQQLSELTLPLAEAEIDLRRGLA
jgi:hypothetical protein